MNTLELSKLAPTVNFNSLSTQSPNSLIIGLSGASGFLGLHLLNELSKDKRIKEIKCFIRNIDKYYEKKKEFNLFFNENKITLINIMKKEDFENINYFIHNAAHLNSLMNYQQLWDDNVLLTSNILSLIKCKIQYISTLSVFASSNQQGFHDCNAVPINENFNIIGGYAQTKFISEYLVSQYSDFQIIRLGLLTPSTINPHFQKHEFMYKFIEILKQIKKYPENFEEAFVDLSPVDIVAKIICKEIFSPTSQYFHIANKKSTSLSEIIGLTQCKEVSLNEWEESIKKYKKTIQILLNYAFFKTKSIEKYPQYYNIDLFQTTNHDWNGQIDDIMIDKYISLVGN